MDDPQECMDDPMKFEVSAHTHFRWSLRPSRVSFRPMNRTSPASKLPTRLREGFPGQRLVIVPPQIVRRSLERPITRDLCVTHIGHFSAARGHFVHRPRGTSRFILLFCLSGSGHCSLAGKQHPIRSGSMVILPPDKNHSYGADDRSPWSVFWAHFGGARAVDYAECLDTRLDQPVVEFRETAPLWSAYEDAFHHALHGFSDSSMLGMSTALARLIGLARTMQVTRAQKTRGHTCGSSLLQTLERMRADPLSTRPVAAWARDAGMSAVHFTSRVREHTGLAPGTYLIRLRLQVALELLQRGNHNVAEAARAAGYEDPFYFSRLFRRHMGMAPSHCKMGP
jgi:AraC family transcriptional regulator, arabinose operon regulatory protein